MSTTLLMSSTNQKNEARVKPGLICNERQVKKLLRKLKNWIIKKLGGYTSIEYTALQSELAVTNKVHQIAVINREVKTFKCVYSLPEYLKETDFDVKKYAIAEMSDAIINSGALHVAENYNPALCLKQFELTMKVVI